MKINENTAIILIMKNITKNTMFIVQELGSQGLNIFLWSFRVEL